MSDEHDSWFKDAFGLDLASAALRIQDEASQVAAGVAGAVSQAVQGLPRAISGVIDVVPVAKAAAGDLRPAVALNDGLVRAPNDDLLEFECRLVTVNKTGAELRNFAVKVDAPTRFKTRPPAAVPARQSSAYTVVGKESVSGGVTWITDAGAGIGEVVEFEYFLTPDTGRITQKVRTTSSPDTDRFTKVVDVNNSRQNEIRFVVAPTGPPPSPQSFVSAVTITNDTDALLRKTADTLSSGVPETTAPTTIPPRQSIDFQVRSSGALADPAQQFVAGALTWTPDGGAEVWSMDFTATAAFDPTANSNIAGNRFIADKPQINGKSFRFKLRNQGSPPPPSPDSFVSNVFVVNQTTATLRLRSDTLGAGVFEPRPRDTIAPNQVMQFAVRSVVRADSDQPRETVDGILIWRAASGEDWLIQYSESPQGTKVVETSDIASQQFIADVTSKGNEFEFRLRNNPQPQPPPQFVGRVTVQNNTDVALRNADQILPAGTFGTAPPDSIAAGTTAVFTVNSERDPADGTDSFDVTVVWEPDVPERDERWSINVRRASQDQQGTPQQQLEGTRFQADPPVVNGDDFQFTLNGETAEPEFKPPVEARQPTLRLNDQSVDGWVEYLQERLNVRLKKKRNVKVDGTYGPITQQAVFAYQNQEGLQQDGTVGNQTWASLRLADRENVGTDGREPGTFVEQGVEARWSSEAPGTFSNANDRLQLEVVSVGTETPLEGLKVSVFATAPGNARRGTFANIGPPIRPTQTGQGNVHLVVIENFKKRFPSEPKDQDIEAYVIEAFFDQALGGDFFTSTKKPITVVP